MKENMAWEDLQKVREEIKENAMDMIKGNLDNFLTKESLETWKTINHYGDLGTPQEHVDLNLEG